MTVLLAFAGGWSQPVSASTCSGFQSLFGGCHPAPTTTTTRASAPAPAPPPAPAPAPPPAPPAPAPAPAPFDGAGAANHLLDLVNAERAGAGLAPMTMRADIVAIALGQSQAMADAGSIWHNPNYLTSATRSALAAKAMGENVAMNMSVDAAHVALMNSPGHRANILNPVFTVTGMAVVQDPRGAVFITQDFVQPSGATPKGVTAVKPAAVKATLKPRAPAAPKPAAAPTTAAPAEPSTTAGPTTTTTAAPEVEAELATRQLAVVPPLDAPGSEPAGPVGLAMVLLLTVGTVSLRVATRR